ncbi:uncharacterized protein PHA67_005069 [Liasis olivaceus]
MPDGRTSATSVGAAPSLMTCQTGLVQEGGKTPPASNGALAHSRRDALERGNTFDAFRVRPQRDDFGCTIPSSKQAGQLLLLLDSCQPKLAHVKASCPSKQEGDLPLGHGAACRKICKGWEEAALLNLGPPDVPELPSPAAAPTERKAGSCDLGTSGKAHGPNPAPEHPSAKIIWSLSDWDIQNSYSPLSVQFSCFGRNGRTTEGETPLCSQACCWGTQDSLWQPTAPKRCLSLPCICPPPGTLPAPSLLGSRHLRFQSIHWRSVGRVGSQNPLHEGRDTPPGNRNANSFTASLEAQTPGRPSPAPPKNKA